MRVDGNWQQGQGMEDFSVAGLPQDPTWDFKTPRGLTCCISNTIAPHSGNTKQHGGGVRTLIKSRKKMDAGEATTMFKKGLRNIVFMFQGRILRFRQAKFPQGHTQQNPVPTSTCIHSGRPATLPLFCSFRVPPAFLPQDLCTCYLHTSTVLLTLHKATVLSLWCSSYL